MARYKLKKTIYRITFDETTEFQGLEMMVSSLTTGRLLEMMELAKNFAGREEEFAEMPTLAKLQEEADKGEKKSKFTEADMKKIRELFTGFANCLVDWNLDEDEIGEDGRPTGRDIPVPCTLAGVFSLDFKMTITLILRWINEIANIDVSLGKESNSGETSPEVPLPMEVLS